VTSNATYVYCAMRSGRKPDLSRAPRGLRGMARPRALDADDGMWLVVADAPLAQYGERQIERGLRDLSWVSRCALAHEALVEHLARTATVVPMKLFTLYTSDERALARLRRTRRRIDAVTTRIAGCDEWGVRVYVERDAGRRPRGAPRAPRPTSGRAFLEAKKEQQRQTRTASDRGHVLMTRVYRALAREAGESLRRAPDGADLALDAVYLVSRSTHRGFQVEVRREGARLAREGYKLVLTGPWPAYHFVARAS
jgi:hypothetical protein